MLKNNYITKQVYKYFKYLIPTLQIYIKTS